jgi:hypothetical protein
VLVVADSSPVPTGGFNVSRQLKLAAVLSLLAYLGGAAAVLLRR